jgi:hypothetical protein
MSAIIQRRATVPRYEWPVLSVKPPLAYDRPKGACGSSSASHPLSAKPCQHVAKRELRCLMVLRCRVFIAIQSISCFRS